MKVTEKDVAYVADLANLELTAEERAGMLRDLNSILEYVDRLNELDTSDVPPMAQVSDRYGVEESKQGASDSLTPAAKMFSKGCASRCRMRKRWRMRPTPTRIFPGAEGDRAITPLRLPDLIMDLTSLTIEPPAPQCRSARRLRSRWRRRTTPASRRKTGRSAHF